MKNCIGKVWHDNPLAVLMKLFMFTAVLGWVLSTAPVVGHAAASKSFRWAAQKAATFWSGLLQASPIVLPLQQVIF